MDDALTAEQDEDSADLQTKVHFGRENRLLLNQMPSAALRLHPRLHRSWRVRFFRVVAFGLLGIMLLIAVVSLAIYTIGVDAIGNERLRRQADLVLTKVAGTELDIHLGELQLNLGTSSLFTLQVKNARIDKADDKTSIVSASTLSFGIRAFPLLWGKLELSQISISDAQLSAPAIQNLLGSTPKNGILNPDELQHAAFGLVRTLYSTAENAGLSRLSFRNVVVSDGQSAGLVTLENLEFQLSGDTLQLDGAADVAGSQVLLDVDAERQSDMDLVSNLNLNVMVSGVERSPDQAGLIRRLGGIKASLQGSEEGAGKKSWLLLDLGLADLQAVDRDDELTINNATFRIGLNQGDPGFSIMRSSLATGRSLVNFEGTVIPDEADSKAYRFDLAIRNSHIAPLDSPEEPLPFVARLEGKAEPFDGRLTAGRIELRTDGGAVNASASLQFLADKAPGITLALDVEKIPTTQAKQLWPWFTAPGARRWVLENLFSGMIGESSLRVNIAPGRLGNGVPLGHEEVSGQFNITGARFDLVDELPAVRESDGWVEFEGTDVFVGLTGGTAYLPSGRIVRTGGGTMELAAAHLKPRIGNLEIDISGDAPAVAEFASLRPINASFLDLKPDDLSGYVTGHVSAQVPLNDGVPLEKLGWNVELAFDNLALAKPVEGQEIRAATGTMLLDRNRAELSGNAELNGLPARLELFEPLGSSKQQRHRKIELEVKDADRDRLFPGLDTLVSGPMAVTYEQGNGPERKISVNLAQARLSVPWIGWQKGSGIPAKAWFTMTETKGRTELSDFKLEGDSFGLSGRILLGKSRLQEARFNRVRFNRDDELSADIKASGKGYMVSVTGKSFDARSIIKLVTGKETKETANADEDPITLKASLGALHGFHGVKMEQAVVEYTTGNGPDRLSIRAATPTYGGVRFDRWMEGGQRKMTLASENGGEVLRFLDIYQYMEGGRLNLALSGSNDNALRGRFTATDFWVVNEPKLSSLVAASSKSGSANGKVDATRVQFGSAAADLAKGANQIDLANGVIRGPSIGLAFQGTLYDPNNNTNMTGTFMPLYGLNRIFGEIPIIGQILGNGRDRGLIGITFRVLGPFDQPRLEVNPISAIAPGIFRQIFEFN